MLKEMKWSAILRSAVYMILGIILIIFPDTTARTLCYLGGGAVVIIGVVTLITYQFRELKIRYYRNDFVVGLIEVLLGLFCIYKAQLLIALLPFILGIFVAISGFCKLQNGLDVKRMGYSNWHIIVLLAALNIVFGMVLLWNPFTAAVVMYIVIGVGLVFSGITDLVLTILISGQVHRYFTGVENKPEAEVTYAEAADVYEDSGRHCCEDLPEDSSEDTEV